LIDVVEGNRTYVPCIYLLNKIDQISIEELGKLLPWCIVPYMIFEQQGSWNSVL
jgi:ribosome-interacting GTPase 1